MTQETDRSKHLAWDNKDVEKKEPKHNRFVWKKDDIEIHKQPNGMNRLSWNIDDLEIHKLGK